MHAHGREAVGGPAYARHRPEETGFYRLIEQHYPALVAHLAEQGRVLPAYVEQEFEAYLKCGRLEHGFLRVRCESCHFERLVTFSCKRRGFCPSCGARRMAETAALLADEGAMTQLLGSSVTYRIAVGPRAGRQALVLRTITPLAGEDTRNERVAKPTVFPSTPA